VIPVANRSHKTVKFKVVPKNIKTFGDSALSLVPETTQEIVLKPKEIYNVEVRFRPRVRLPPFEHEINLMIEGIDEPRKLITVAGVAHGVEL